MFSWLLPAHAGTAAGSFGVVLNLTSTFPPPTTGGTLSSQPSFQPGFARGTCLSQTLSNQTQASVRVVCGSSQFVSIELLPGRPFVGTHGGAYRFVFGPGTPLSPVLSESNILLGGSGTVTGLRLIDISGLESFLEMLVSF